MKHPDELTLARMVDGELPPERTASTRTHLIECARCQASYEALKTETEILRATLREDEESLPAAFREKDSLGWLLAAAAVLGALGVSSLWKGIVEPVLSGMDRVGLDGGSLFTTILIRSLLFRGWTEMATTITEVAFLVSLVLTLAAAAIWSWRRIRHAAMAVALGAAFLFHLPSPGEGAIIEHGRDTYVLPRGETLANDLIVAAEIVRIEGVLLGDLIVAARLVEVSGSVGGDVLGFAESIDVTGEVAGNVRTGSRALNLDGVVGRNVTAAGETIRLRSGGRVEGSFTAAAREAIVSAPVGGDLLAAAQTHEIGARVGGSALLAGERLRIGPSASIAGPVKFYGAVEPEVAPEAQLASPLEFEKVEEKEERSPFAWLSRFVYFWAAAFLLGAALVLLAPRAAEAITAVHMPAYAKSCLVGVASLGAFVALSIALTVTLVGIPLALVTVFFGCTALYAAQIYAGVFIGKRLLGPPTDRSQLVVRLAVGLLAIHIGKAIPFVEHVVDLLVTLWGFGAIVLWLLESVGRSSTPGIGVAAPGPGGQGAEVSSGG